MWYNEGVQCLRVVVWSLPLLATGLVVVTATASLLHFFVVILLYSGLGEIARVIGRFCGGGGVRIPPACYTVAR